MKLYIRPFSLMVCFLILFNGLIWTLNTYHVMVFWLLSGLFFSLVMVASLLMYPRVYPTHGWHATLQRYIVFPLALYVGLIGFLFFNHNLDLQHVVVVIAAMAYFVIYSELYSDLTHLAHDMVKFFTLFLIYNSVLESVRYLDVPQLFIPVLIWVTTMFIFTHMLWRLKSLREPFPFITMLSSGVIAVTSYALVAVWPISSYLVLGLLLLFVYYIFWGILMHLIDRTFSLHVVFEYIFIGFLGILMLVGLYSGL